MTKKNSEHNAEKRDVTRLIIPLEEFKERISDRIEMGQNFLKTSINHETVFNVVSEAFDEWNDYNLALLTNVFNYEENEYKYDYDRAGFFSNSFFQRTPQSKETKLRDRIHEKVKNLQLLFNKADLIKTTESTKPDRSEASLEVEELSNEIFIVHGHNEAIRLDVARTIEHLGYKPIILNEQANEGATVIEKFEANSNVSFAIILLTNDDKGNVKSKTDLNPRARQNVVFEFGFFIGKLGRKRVCVLYEEGVELPSDIHGFAYILIDSAGGWKLKLVKEMKVVGYKVDSNLLK